MPSGTGAASAGAPCRRCIIASRAYASRDSFANAAGTCSPAPPAPPGPSEAARASCRLLFLLLLGRAGASGLSVFSGAEALPAAWPLSFIPSPLTGAAAEAAPPPGSFASSAPAMLLPPAVRSSECVWMATQSPAADAGGGGAERSRAPSLASAAAARRAAAARSSAAAAAAALGTPLRTRSLTSSASASGGLGMTGSAVGQGLLVTGFCPVPGPAPARCAGAAAASSANLAAKRQRSNASSGGASRPAARHAPASRFLSLRPGSCQDSSTASNALYLLRTAFLCVRTLLNVRVQGTPESLTLVRAR